jgi:Cu/Ag efflux pump CusA
MIRSIIGSSLRFRLLVIGIAAGVMVLGVTQLRQAPVDVLPEFTPPYVEVQTEALGLSAEEVEQLVTVPLEADLLNGTAGVSVLRSESVPGESSITLLFEPGTSIMDARQLVQEQLTQAHANPNVSQPPQMLQPLSSQSRVMMIGLSPNKLSEIQASVLARWTIRPRLLGVPGVANVAIFGLRDRQLQVLVDPERLRDSNVTLNQVVRTAGNAQLVSPLSFLEASTPGTSGFFDTANQRLQIRHILPTVTPAKLAQVPVEGAQQGGETLRLGKVTRVVQDHQPLIGDSIVGSGTGLLLVVEKFPGANTLEVTRDVDAAMNELKPGLSGMQVDSHVFRPADYIQKAIDNLTLAVIIGCALLALLLFTLFFEWRSALVSFASFAVSMTAAALLVSVTGSTFNAVVFAGLALAIGVVVGDSVMDVDNVRRRRHAERGGASTAATVIASAQEIRGPLGYATVIILLAAAPVLFIEGVTGSFLAPLARSYALAVLASTVVALTLTPTLASLLLSKPRHGESPLLRRPGRRYGAALARVIAKPRLVIAAAAAALLVGVAVIPALSGPVIPSFKDRDFLVHLDGAPGTSRPEMARIVARASRELRSLPGVSDVGAHLGRAVTGDQVVDVNSSEIWVKADADADYNATKASIENVIKGYPGFNHSVVTYEKQRLRDVAAVDDKQAGGTSASGADLDVLTGADRRPLVVRIYGENQKILGEQGARMQQLMSKVDGVVDPRVESQPQEPTVAIEVNLDKALRYGIKPGDMRRKAATLLQGIQVGALFEQQKVFDVVVRATPRVRRSLTDVRRLLVDTPNGGHVRLGNVARVHVRPTPSVIQRESSSRRIDVTATVSGRSLDAVRDDVRHRIRALTFPLEYHAQVITDSTGREATAGRLLAIGLAAALGIFLLLQAAFRSWRLASLAFATLPIALVGCELAGLLDGGTFSLGSLAGVLAVFAIAARNSVSQITSYQRLEAEGETFGSGVVLRGAGERFTPVFATGAGTALAFVPFVLLGNRPGYEIVHPMAVAVLGGLVTTIMLSLFVVPALYVRFAASTGAKDVPDEVDLLHRWAGIEPAPAGREGAVALPAPVDGDGVAGTRPARPNGDGADEVKPLSVNGEEAPTPREVPAADGDGKTLGVDQERKGE